MLTDSSRFCASSHASSGLKNSNNGSADNRDVLPRVITFINCDAGSEAPFCMKSLEWKFEILSSAGHELNIFHPSIFQRRHDVKWKSRSIRTLITDPPPEIDKSRMCVMVRRDLPLGTAQRRFETEGWWRQSIWCSPDPIWCDTWRRHRSASWCAKAAESSPGSATAGPTSERSCRPVPSRTRTSATVRVKKIQFWWIDAIYMRTAFFPHLLHRQREGHEGQLIEGDVQQILDINHGIATRCRDGRWQEADFLQVNRPADVQTDGVCNSLTWQKN